MFSIFQKENFFKRMIIFYFFDLKGSAYRIRDGQHFNTLIDDLSQNGSCDEVTGVHCSICSH